MPAGRPSKYKPEYAEQAYKLCLLGATDKQLADFFSTSEQTVNSWKENYPEFLESLKRGKEIADATVAEKLYHRAIGYEHEEIVTASFQGRITDTMEITKHYAPDPTAAIFWLKNRQPKQWRDKHEVESKNENTNNNFNFDITPEERDRIIQEHIDKKK
jgi:hypothetical protein